MVSDDDLLRKNGVLMGGHVLGYYQYTRLFFSKNTSFMGLQRGLNTIPVTAGIRCFVGSFRLCGVALYSYNIFDLSI